MARRVLAERGHRIHRAARTLDRLNGGLSMSSSPDGEPTLRPAAARLELRVAPELACMSFSRALAMSAASSRSTISTAFSFRKTALISACIASRLLNLVPGRSRNRGSVFSPLFISTTIAESARTRARSAR